MISRPSVASRGSHTPPSPPFRIEIGTKDRKIKKFLSKKYRNNPQPRSNVLLSNSDILYSKFSHFFHTFSSEHFEQFNKEALYRASQLKQNSSDIIRFLVKILCQQVHRIIRNNVRHLQ